MTQTMHLIFSHRFGALLGIYGRLTQNRRQGPLLVNEKTCLVQQCGSLMCLIVFLTMMEDVWHRGIRSGFGNTMLVRSINYCLWSSNGICWQDKYRISPDLSIKLQQFKLMATTNPIISLCLLKTPGNVIKRKLSTSGSLQLYFTSITLVM